MHNLECRHCGEDFTAVNAHAATCSTRCRQARARANRAALHALAVELLLADADADADSDAYDRGDPKCPDYVDGLLGRE